MVDLGYNTARNYMQPITLMRNAETKFSIPIGIVVSQKSDPKPFHSKRQKSPFHRRFWLRQGSGKISIHFGHHLQSNQVRGVPRYAENPNSQCHDFQ